jgi:hypothetical protein
MLAVYGVSITMQAALPFFLTTKTSHEVEANFSLLRTALRSRHSINIKQ